MNFKKKSRIITIAIVAVIILAAAGVGVYFFTKNSNDLVEVTDNTALYLHPQTDISVFVSPTKVTPSQQPLQSMEPKQSEPLVQPKPLPLPPSKTLPRKLFTSKEKQFSIEVPGNWLILPAQDEVVIKTPEQVRFSIQMYVVEGNTVELLKSFLAGQLNLRNIIASNVNGYEALEFDVDGAYVHGYALLYKDRLYYLLGKNISRSPIVQTFKVL